MSTFNVRETVLMLVERLRDFFWCSNEKTKKMVWIKWQTILSLLDHSGLGVGTLNTFN